MSPRAFALIVLVAASLALWWRQPTPSPPRRERVGPSSQIIIGTGGTETSRVRVYPLAEGVTDGVRCSVDGGKTWFWGRDGVCVTEDAWTAK